MPACLLCQQTLMVMDDMLWDSECDPNQMSLKKVQEGSLQYALGLSCRVVMLQSYVGSSAPCAYNIWYTEALSCAASV